MLVIAHDPLFPHVALRSLLVRRSLAHRTLRLHLGDPGTGWEASGLGR